MDQAQTKMQNGALSELDARLVAALRADGRMSNAELARRLGVTEPTVRKHLNGLIESGQMQVVAVVNPYRVGFETDTNIGLHVPPEHILDVAAALSELPEVRYVAMSTGAYDLILAAMFRSNDELFEFLTSKLAAIPNIVSSETSHVLRVFKRTFDWVVPGGDGFAAPRIDSSQTRARTRGSEN